MAVNGIYGYQAFLQDIPSAAGVSDSTQGTFASLLAESLQLQLCSKDTGADMFSEMFESGSPYALLSCLIKPDGLGVMAQSLCEAFSKDNTNMLSFASAGYVTTTGPGIIPAQPWEPAQPAITSNVYNRSASLYTSVIKQFSVETNDRYKPGGGTYCNIFVWDVSSAMGAEIPHYYDVHTGKPMKRGDEGANQMNANAMYKWLHNYGDQYGWFEVTPEEAQDLANQGHPVVTALYRSDAHGHVQMVCPSKDGRYDAERGVTIAQAGRRLTSYRPITQIYNASLSKVSYFAHM